MNAVSPTERYECGAVSGFVVQALHKRSLMRMMRNSSMDPDRQAPALVPKKSASLQGSVQARARITSFLPNCNQ
uniref:Uncharacterized protein n=1 Tax=Ditylenchus dipsaci TaxID=166011 RepID=A0A915D7E8_9BILA